MKSTYYAPVTYAGIEPAVWMIMLGSMILFIMWITFLARRSW